MPSERYVVHTAAGEEEHSAGGVVYRRTGAGVEIVIIERLRYGDWSLPKGHLEAHETHEAAALREVWEETGLRGRIESRLGEIRYPITGRSGRPTIKVVTHFLIAALDPATPLVTPPKEVDAARWLPLAAAEATLTWPGDRAMATAAARMLGDRQQTEED